ncbi:uncharacterized protein B0I36DRAFT_356884 [Microdochium trichocladiopsis]|uniref:Uncharacterized protein n=1 Tax=Microdochium trichocladiopsis TaxID=1682393 RepID=A0A9P8XPA1_9PEZI|nr:uncharacterized protein B0I36DRAFT_356884 [Microdochium trichocladiopsis]KAH7007939.1 hypothetical protein B0I36DRAFT_356884 [Microdochium trichocladiopsis]
MMRHPGGVDLMTQKWGPAPSSVLRRCRDGLAPVPLTAGRRSSDRRRVPFGAQRIQGPHLTPVPGCEERRHSYVGLSTVLSLGAADSSRTTPNRPATPRHDSFLRCS